MSVAIGKYEEFVFFVGSHVLLLCVCVSNTQKGILIFFLSPLHHVLSIESKI